MGEHPPIWVWPPRHPMRLISRGERCALRHEARRPAFGEAAEIDELHVEPAERRGRPGTFSPAGRRRGPRSAAGSWWRRARRPAARACRRLARPSPWRRTGISRSRRDQPDARPRPLRSGRAAFVGRGVWCFACPDRSSDSPCPSMWRGRRRLQRLPRRTRRRVRRCRRPLCEKAGDSVVAHARGGRFGLFPGLERAGVTRPRRRASGALPRSAARRHGAPVPRRARRRHRGDAP